MVESRTMPRAERTAIGQTAFTRLTASRNLLSIIGCVSAPREKIHSFYNDLFIDAVNKFKTHILQNICMIETAAYSDYTLLNMTETDS